MKMPTTLAVVLPIKVINTASERLKTLNWKNPLSNNIDATTQSHTINNRNIRPA